MLAVIEMAKLGRAILLLVPALAVLSQDATGQESPTTGLVSTKHNLSGKDALTEKSAKDSRAICVFCHTPTADSSGIVTSDNSPAVVPTWQSGSTKAQDGFITYDDIGRQGADGREFLGSQSFACLSCHDATQALAVTNLAFDHPFGVPYRGAYLGRGRQLTLEQETVKKGEVPYRFANNIRNDEEFRSAVSGQVGGRQQWWVPTTSAGVKTRADLPLYPRESDTGELVPFIECGSCHDPHMASDMFLRVNNNGSKLCLTCHEK